MTADDEVPALLRKIAVREGEHGMAFAKRINELGYEVRDTPDPRFDEQMEIVQSDRSDLDKLEALGLLKIKTDDEPDIFDGFFRDHSIDIQTGELLGRYIAKKQHAPPAPGCKTNLEFRAPPPPLERRDLRS